MFTNLHEVFEKLQLIKLNITFSKINFLNIVRTQNCKPIDPKSFH